MLRGRCCALLVCVLAFVFGCAGRVRELHPLGGNEFTLFPGERRAPPPITCRGETQERFACFARELQERGKKLDISGAFALSTPDGKIRSAVQPYSPLWSSTAPMSNLFPPETKSKPRFLCR